MQHVQAPAKGEGEEWRLWWLERLLLLLLLAAGKVRHARRLFWARRQIGPNTCANARAHLSSGIPPCVPLRARPLRYGLHAAGAR